MTTQLAPPAEPESTVRPNEQTSASRWRRRAPLLPALVFAIIVTQLPFLVTLVISTLNWNILRPGERSFAGLSNYLLVFTDVATKVTQDISAAIAGNGDVTAALDNGQKLAQTAADKYKGK